MPSTFTLPQPDEFADTMSRHYHAEFMQAFYTRTCKDLGLRILMAIENTAERTGSAPEAVARALVECGLRAPKEFLPEKFAGSIEKTARDPDIYRARLSVSQKELLQSWQPFAFASRILSRMPFLSREIGASFSMT